MKSNNGLQKATKIVSFLMVIVLAVFAIYFAIRSGSYVVATPTDGSEIKDITTPFGTMNPNQYALILVLISLWLFVGCVFAFITGIIKMAREKSFIFTLWEQVCLVPEYPRKRHLIVLYC